MHIKLYSTNCPKCNVLQQKLGQKGLEYELIEGEEPIRNLGYMEAPILQVDGENMTFPAAMRWLNSKSSTIACASCKLGE